MVSVAARGAGNRGWRLLDGFFRTVEKNGRADFRSRRGWPDGSIKGCVMERQ